MNKANILSEYKQSLKNPAAEEVVDLVFFRPVAFLLVKAIGRLPITPNQVSFCSMVAGVSAGIFFSGGGRRGFVVGAILYILANIFDCGDGMIARLKKNGTPTGRIVDGVVDYINGIAVYAGLGIGLTKAAQSGVVHLPFNAWALMIAAAASFAAHAMLSDKYRNAYLEQLRGASEPAEGELEKFKTERKRLEGVKGRIFDKALISLYLKYLATQKASLSAQTMRETGPLPPVRSRTVVAWNCIGPSTHITFLVVPMAFLQPNYFFLYVIGAANAWMTLLLLYQVRAKPQGA